MPSDKPMDWLSKWIVMKVGNNPIDVRTLYDHFGTAIDDLVANEVVNADHEGRTNIVLSLSDEGHKVMRAIDEGDL